MTEHVPTCSNVGLVPRVFMVTARRQELADTVSLLVAPQDGSALPNCRPGQFNMLYAHGVGEIPVSISGLGRNGQWRHTIRGVGRTSEAICKLKPGAHLGLRGPFGVPWPLDALAGKSLILVAGGLGLAPLRGAIELILKERNNFGKVCIYYGARTPEDALFRDQWPRWQQAPDTTFRATVDRLGKAGSQQSPWQGSVGVVTALLPRTLPPGDWAALVCGPEAMMRHVSQDLEALGIAPAQIFLSLERNMKCAIGLCGHCQWNRHFICRDGPVFSLQRIAKFLQIKEL